MRRSGIPDPFEAPDVSVDGPANRLKGKLPAIEISESRVVSVDEGHELADAIGGRWEAFVLFAFYAGPDGARPQPCAAPNSTCDVALPSSRPHWPGISR